MKLSIAYDPTCGALGCRPLHLVLIVAAALAVLPWQSFADEHDGGNRGGASHDRGGKHAGDRHGRQGGRDHRGSRPEYSAPYSYAQPVYVPPPVYYEPQRSAGISLFFPLDLR